MLTALSSPLRNLLYGTLFMVAVSLVATLAYVAYGWSVGDAIYMVILTVYTVGYDEVRPIDTPTLRAITIGLIVTGCTGMIFLTGSLIQLITVSQFQAFFGVRRMQKDIDQLAGHIIICGYGRIGQSLSMDLKAGGANFVVIDRGESRHVASKDSGFLSMQGDATDEDVLKQAGILRAKALATVLPDDAANVFITLSARSLNKDLTIIARGEMPSTERKLIQAGADRVVLPDPYRGRTHRRTPVVPRHGRSPREREDRLDQQGTRPVGARSRNRRRDKRESVHRGDHRVHRTSSGRHLPDRRHRTTRRDHLVSATARIHDRGGRRHRGRRAPRAQRGDADPVHDRGRPLIAQPPAGRRKIGLPINRETFLIYRKVYQRLYGFSVAGAERMKRSCPTKDLCQ